MTYKGSCHCGRIAYEVDLDLNEVVECNCSICSRRGYLLTFVPREALRLSTPETNLTAYQFNKMKVSHYFCNVCGCAPFGQGAMPNGVMMAAINVRCLEGVDPKALTIKPVDGRSL